MVGIRRYRHPHVSFVRERGPFVILKISVRIHSSGELTSRHDLVHERGEERLRGGKGEVTGASKTYLVDFFFPTQSTEYGRPKPVTSNEATDVKPNHTKLLTTHRDTPTQRRDGEAAWLIFAGLKTRTRSEAKRREVVQQG